LNVPVSPFRSLRVRLITSVVIIEIVTLSLLVWSNLAVIRQAYADRLWDTASGLLEQVATTSGTYLLEVDYASLEEYLRNFTHQEELAYLMVLDRDRHPVVTFGQLPATFWPPSDRHPLAVDDGILDLSREILIGNQAMGEVHAGFSLAPMQHAINSARLRSIVIAGTEITLTILATVFIGVHLTRRLGRLASAAQQVGSGDYAVSVPAEVNDEVGMTATAFNRMVSEVSQRTRRLEETLARERVIEETSLDGMLTYDAGTRILSVNPAMQQLFGYAAELLLGKPASLLLAPLCDRENPPRDADFWTRTTVRPLEITGRRQDGSCFPLELYIGRVTLNGDPLFAATLHDITERKQAERECRNLLEGNRFLIHKSLAVQEEERRHLAQELHDELGQCMTAIQADAETIHALSKDSNARIAGSASAIVSVSTRMYAVVHSMMQRLRPSVLDNFGLVAAVAEELDAWKARYPGVDCRFEKHGNLQNLGEQINISLYRIVQESLTNIAKHAAASRVLLALSRADDGLHLHIEDNGRGMDVDKPSRGLGLIGMRERVEALHGTLAISSVPGRGTAITVTVPVV
jgi:two-component system sensor histidine kinase UhpB